MSDSMNSEFEAWLSQQAQSSEEADLLRESHRLLEQDLFRLSDPLPPGDFLQNVMAKVEASPRPALAKTEILSGLGIVGFAIGLALYAIFHGTSGSIGLSIGNILVFVREAYVALDAVLEALWSTAAIPLSMVVCLSLMVSLFGLKRMAQPAVGQKVVV
jgi:hypothetical protein